MFFFYILYSFVFFNSKTSIDLDFINLFLDLQKIKVGVNKGSCK